ncbi:MAG: HlyD family efflux transporter periplasmic adaptor subunit [Acidobacteria bacterium]|nr:HlyD family efflux transporter periplasmic adaptor subunit [Acidobacteriota bacterium]
MDIARPDLARKKRLRHSLYSVSALIAIALVTVGVSRLEPAAPRVDRDTIYLDTVQRGPMVRQVRGTGTLVPEQIRWIPATTDGTVERIVIRPGALVAPDTVILEMSNPELEQSALEARLNLEAAEARYSNRQVEVERELLNQRATLATTEAQLKNARLQADADGQLFKQGLVASLQLQQSQSAEQEYETRYALERERLQMATDTVEAQLAVEQAEVDRLRTLYELRRQQVADLHVRAGMPGVLQQVPLEEGQRIATGANLARVGDPAVLKAELRIAETQAKDIQIGQTAAVDTRNGVIPGHVTRIDPAVENGTVTVDVALDGELPRGARPDLTVDGTIELERMDDVLFVGRPVFGQEENVVSLFRVDEDGMHASRTRVRLGRASVNTIEVLEGLKPGDRVVLSDMSTWDQFDRVRIE